jgi:hypothetical protein
MRGPPPVAGIAVTALVVLACGGERHDRSPPPATTPAPTATPTATPRDGGPPPVRSFPALGAALAAIVPDDARVVGFGELHQRLDRPQARSALAVFTAEGLPALAPRLSDLVVETWLVDPKCGASAREATTRLETTMQRPATTKSEIAQLADAARAAGIQPHAMTLACTDYATIAPAGGEVDPVAMLTLTTRELGRVAASAVSHRDGEPGHRPLIALYGGALHNDRFPDAGVAEWSYAAAIDRATGGHFVEIDLIVPEFADGDQVAARQPWFPLLAEPATTVRVWQRGERSFVVVLPRAR